MRRRYPEGEDTEPSLFDLPLDQPDREPLEEEEEDFASEPPRPRPAPVREEICRAAVRLIYEEVCQRQELGQEVPAAELHARFPHWRRELDLLTARSAGDLSATARSGG